MQKIKKVEYVLQGGQRLGRKKHHLTCPNHTSESVRSGQQQQHHPQDMEDLTPKRQPSTTKPSGPLVRTIHSPPHPRSPSPLLSSAPAPASASQPASPARQAAHAPLARRGRGTDGGKAGSLVSSWQAVVWPAAAALLLFCSLSCPS